MALARGAERTGAGTGETRAGRRASWRSAGREACRSSRTRAGGEARSAGTAQRNLAVTGATSPDDLPALPELDALTGEAPAIDAASAPPTAGEQPAGEGAAQPPQLDRAAYEASAAFMVAMVGAGLRMATGVELTAPDRAQIADDLAPVLMKYNGKMPPWLERWKEELTLAKTLAVVGWSVYQQMQQQAAAKAAQLAPQSPAQPAGEGATVPVA